MVSKSKAPSLGDVGQAEAAPDEEGLTRLGAPRIMLTRATAPEDVHQKHRETKEHTEKQASH